MRFFCLKADKIVLRIKLYFQKIAQWQTTIGFLLLQLSFFCVRGHLKILISYGQDPTYRTPIYLKVFIYIKKKISSETRSSDKKSSVEEVTEEKLLAMPPAARVNDRTELINKRRFYHIPLVFSTAVECWNLPLTQIVLLQDLYKYNKFQRKRPKCWLPSLLVLFLFFTNNRYEVISTKQRR